ncbi:MAG: hypothetical protein EHM41_19025 [Chloroflexi bacterium]|nr:MAG: hypothetical protein EHM41_19025 [Chloroflexota bacterium]
MFTTNRKDIQTVLNRDTAGQTVMEMLIHGKGLLSLWDYSIAYWFRTRRLYLLGRMISQLYRSQRSPLAIVDLDHNLLADAVRVQTARVVGP